MPQGYRLKINITNFELGINYVEYFFTGLKIWSRGILKFFPWLHTCITFNWFWQIKLRTSVYFLFWGGALTAYLKYFRFVAFIFHHAIFIPYEEFYYFFPHVTLYLCLSSCEVITQSEHSLFLYVFNDSTQTVWVKRCFSLFPWCTRNSWSADKIFCKHWQTPTILCWSNVLF